MYKRYTHMYIYIYAYVYMHIILHYIILYYIIIGYIRRPDHQGNPHIRESRIWAQVRSRMQTAGLQCPKAPDCGCLSRPANSCISRHGAFPGRSGHPSSGWGSEELGLVKQTRRISSLASTGARFAAGRVRFRSVIPEASFMQEHPP